MTPAEAVVAEAERAIREAGDIATMYHLVESSTGIALGFALGAADAIERRGLGDATELRQHMSEALRDASTAMLHPPAGLHAERRAIEAEIGELARRIGVVLGDYITLGIDPDEVAAYARNLAAALRSTADAVERAAAGS